MALLDPVIEIIRYLEDLILNIFQAFSLDVTFIWAKLFPSKTYKAICVQCWRSREIDNGKNLKHPVCDECLIDIAVDGCNKAWSDPTNRVIMYVNPDRVKSGLSKFEKSPEPEGLEDFINSTKLSASTIP